MIQAGALELGLFSALVLLALPSPLVAAPHIQPILLQMLECSGKGALKTRCFSARGNPLSWVSSSFLSVFSRV